MFFHQGRTVPEPVRINVIEPSGERAVAFDPALFDYGKNKFEPQTLQRRSASTAFASTTRSTSRATRTRSLVFQGASYFRAVGKGQSYGLSARGLAVDTAGAAGRGVPALRRVLDRAAARRARPR